ncbi:hypothetical protein LJ656_04440 [Paraburkholderia sp. MMS20-SJTR3]|uniref:Lysozyme inhibitor LprI N-terminal domain-containing protein n=1 Tax=Paraburkholderia sejongensis TaxID=2886946 RepID=A0ABS8JPJ4_9BURK|nr:hypothetical protein [Paraburkholderia sp. MMS20-SJTR3]MCC8391829.1 hypothetical protein [Paraburkholderia sp. MMS20-SJTR3]
MKKLPNCRRPLCAAVLLSVLSLAVPLTGHAGEEDANLRVETAGERASFAQTFCQVSPERIGAYKERLRTRLTDATHFDQHWDTGWRRAENTNRQMSALRERDPAEFASRIKVNCERLKWMAQNALRPPARK